MATDGFGGFLKAEYGRHIYIKTGAYSFGTKINVAKLGVETTPQASAFTSSPNPAVDYFTITSRLPRQPLKATLRNVSGQIICQQSFPEMKLNIPTTNIPSGLYFLEISGKDVRQNIKVAIQH